MEEKDKVRYLNNVTTLDIPADRVLNGAYGELDNVVVIGWDKEGQFYFSSSIANGPEVLWLLEVAKKKLIEIAEEEK